MGKKSLQITSYNASSTRTRASLLPTSGYMKFSSNENGFKSVSATEIVNEADPNKISWLNTFTHETIEGGSTINSDIDLSVLSSNSKLDWRTANTAENNISVAYNNHLYVFSRKQVSPNLNSYNNGISSGDTWEDNTINTGDNGGVDLLKYDSNGHIIWRTKMVTIGSYGAADIVHMKIVDNNIYLLGTYSNNIHIYDAIAANNPWIDGTSYNITNSNNVMTLFLIKYNLNGQMQWRTKISYHNFSSISQQLNLVVSDFIYISAMHDGSVDCYNVKTRSEEWSNSGLDSIESNSLLQRISLLKYNINGSLIWRNLIDAVNYNNFVKLHITQNNIYLFTRILIDSDLIIYLSSVNSGTPWPENASSTIIPLSSGNPIALIKYDSNGNCVSRTKILANTITDVTSQFASTIIVDDGIYISAYCRNNMQIYEPVTSDTAWTELFHEINVAPSILSICIVKLNLDFELVWRNKINIDQYPGASNIPALPNVNIDMDIYAMLEFNSIPISIYNTIYGTAIWNNSVIATISYVFRGAALLKYNKDGVLLWRTKIDYISNRLNLSVTPDSIYMVGTYYNNNIRIHDVVIGTDIWIDSYTEMTGSSSDNIYILRYDKYGKLLFKSRIYGGQVFSIESIYDNNLYLSFRCAGALLNINSLIKFNDAWDDNITDQIQLTQPNYSNTFILKFNISVPYMLDMPTNKVKYIYATGDTIIDTNDTIYGLSDRLYGDTNSSLTLLPSDKWIVQSNNFIA
jgi:hypothetical protein